MNLLWIALIAGLIFVEKLMPSGDRLGRGLGVLLATTGLFMALA